MNEKMVIAHSAKGTTWENHKYIKVLNGRYIYSNDKSSMDSKINTSNIKRQIRTNAKVESDENENKETSEDLESYNYVTNELKKRSSSSNNTEKEIASTKVLNILNSSIKKIENVSLTNNGRKLTSLKTNWTSSRIEDLIKNNNKKILTRTLSHSAKGTTWSDHKYTSKTYKNGK